MKEAYWGYWLIILGVFVIAIMMMVQAVTTSNTQDYYQLKEVTEASMLESVDYAYYRIYGVVKINREKFVENFLRRFAENASLTSTYKIDFYDLYESPPKVSVKVSNLANTFSINGDSASFNIVNKLDAILEFPLADPDVCKVCSYYTCNDGSTKRYYGGVSYDPCDASSYQNVLDTLTDENKIKFEQKAAEQKAKLCQ